MISQANDAATRPYPREIMTWSEEIYKPLFENRAICGEKVHSLEDIYIIVIIMISCDCFLNPSLLSEKMIMYSEIRRFDCTFH